MSVLTTKVDRVIVIHSLPEQDIGVVRRSVEHLKSVIKPDSAIFVHEHKVRSVEELRTLLQKIDAETRLYGTPLIHLEMHASKDRGLLLVNGESMGWLELSKCLSCINRHTENTMTVVACACFSMEVIYPPRMREPAPFAQLVAPRKEITNDVVESKIFRFYDCMFREGNTDEAMKSVQPEFELFFPERVLFNIVREVVWRYTGNKGKENRERILTEFLQSLPSEYHIEKRDFRKIVREYKDNFEKGDLDDLIGIFMCGRDPFFTTNDLKM